MNPLTETRERFLLAILAKVPAERIAEIHFFPPIKQAGIESGVAVAAAWPEQAVLPEPVTSLESTEVVEASEVVDVAEPDAIEVVDAIEAIDDGEASEADAVVEAGEVTEAADVVEAGEVTEAAEAVEASEAIETDETIEPTEPADVDAAHAEDAEGPSNVPPARHVVYTARYRHILKGIDRGKWESSVVAEADAPLITVDAVVRGVQRRSGDVDDPTRMDGEEVREFVARRAAVATP